MRILSVVLVAFLGGAVQADDDAKAILEKAIKAHGGADKLSKFQAGSLKGKGKVDSPVGELEFTQEVQFTLPDKVKEVAEFTIMGNAIKTVAIINGEKLSLEVNGMNIAVKDALKEVLEDGRSRLQIGRLVPLRDKKFELSSLGEVKVDDKPALGIRVVAKGMKDVNLYFDKKTHLMVKLEGRTVDAQTGKELTEERITSDYKEVDGLPFPQKVVVNRDGKKYMELNIQEVKFLEKLDDSVFKKE